MCSDRAGGGRCSMTSASGCGGNGAACGKAAAPEGAGASPYTQELRVAMMAPRARGGGCRLKVAASGRWFVIPFTDSVRAARRVMSSRVSPW